MKTIAFSQTRGWTSWPSFALQQKGQPFNRANHCYQMDIEVVAPRWREPSPVLVLYGPSIFFWGLKFVLKKFQDFTRLSSNAEANHAAYKLSYFASVFNLFENLQKVVYFRAKRVYQSCIYLLTVKHPQATSQKWDYSELTTNFWRRCSHKLLWAHETTGSECGVAISKWVCSLVDF